MLLVLCWYNIKIIMSTCDATPELYRLGPPMRKKWGQVHFCPCALWENRRNIDKKAESCTFEPLKTTACLSVLLLNTGISIGEVSCLWVVSNSAAYENAKKTQLKVNVFPKMPKMFSHIKEVQNRQSAEEQLLIMRIYCQTGNYKWEANYNLMFPEQSFHSPNADH